MPFTIAGQDLDKGELVLDPIGFVVFSWDFGATNMDCATAGVDKVKIWINTQDGSENLYTSSPVPLCTATPVTIGDFPLGVYNLQLQAFCADDPSIIAYKLDGDLDISEKGENNYASINVPENPDYLGGCP